MLFPSSRPHRIPPSTTDSQYDTTTGYSSSSYTKWPRSSVKSDFHAARNAGSASNPSSRQSNRRRNNPVNESLTDLPTYQYFRPQQQQQQPIYSTITPQRPIVNYLLP
jgi:hypothetical protein